MTGLSSIRRRAGFVLAEQLHSDRGRAELRAGMTARENVRVPAGLEAEFETLFRIIERHRSDPRVIEAALGFGMGMALGLWLIGINPIVSNHSEGQFEGLTVALDMRAQTQASVGGLAWVSDLKYATYHQRRGEFLATLWAAAPLIWEAWMAQAAVPPAPSVRTSIPRRRA